MTMLDTLGLHLHEIIDHFFANARKANLPDADLEELDEMTTDEAIICLEQLQSRLAYHFHHLLQNLVKKLNNYIFDDNKQIESVGQLPGRGKFVQWPMKTYTHYQ